MRKNYFFSFAVDIGGTYTKIGLFKVKLIDENNKYFIDKKDFENNINYYKNNDKEKSFEKIVLIIKNYIVEIKLIESHKIKTQESNNSEIDFINNLIQEFDQILINNNINSITPISFSFAVPGFPDNKFKKVIGGSFNIPFLDKIDFTVFIKKYNEDYTFLNLINDVTSQAYYEQIIKKDIFKSDDDIAILVALGTGIGGSIFTKDKVIVGADGWAAEFGHLPIWFSKLGTEKNICSCGKTNCIEVYGSVKSYIQRLKEKGKNITAEKALDLYKNKESDGDINEITEFWIDSLSSLFASLINIFNPSAIIISGAISKVSNLSYLFYKNTEKYANKYLFKNVMFLSASNADLAGCFGAVIHGIKSEFNNLLKYL